MLYDDYVSANSCELADEDKEIVKNSMKELERTLKSLANRRRLGIVQFLKKRKEASVGELAEAIHLSFRSTSRHLAVLSGAGILEKEQRSIQVYYRLNPQKSPTLEHILLLL